jgi:flagellar biosynthetic protein FliR
MVDWSKLTLFIYVAARMSGFVLFNPLFGRRNIPNLVRAGFILVLTVFVVSTTELTTRVPSGVLEMAIRILLELWLGFLLSMVVSFFFYIPELAGTVIDTQMGMTMNQTYDPGSQSNLSVSGMLLNILTILLFFAANGHLTLIKIMLTSGELVPFGGVTLGTDAPKVMLELFAQCTVLGVKLAMPFLGAELVGQIGMGILMKVIPQINVFAINIELKVIIGLAMMLVLITPVSEFLLKAEMTMLDSISQVLSAAA